MKVTHFVSLHHLCLSGSAHQCAVFLHIISPGGWSSHSLWSPQVALVRWTESVGLTLVSRDLASMQLKTPSGQVLTYCILQMFPFTSESKRMGIIVRVRHGFPAELTHQFLQSLCPGFKSIQNFPPPQRMSRSDIYSVLCALLLFCLKKEEKKRKNSIIYELRSLYGSSW